MKKILLIYILSFQLFAIDSHDNKSDEIILHQLDYRSRLSLMTQIPNIARLEVRIAREIRYRKNMKPKEKKTQTSTTAPSSPQKR